MKNIWKILIIVGSIGLFFSLFQFEYSSEPYIDFFGKWRGQDSSFRINKPYDLVGAISAGMIALGFLVKKK
ncbi:MAG: hypothetical protein FJ214_10865 [Ignavibacteria bacterium]|nr:hypothetical protein [Ignavibacteria bacterium]